MNEISRDLTMNNGSCPKRPETSFENKEAVEPCSNSSCNMEDSLEYIGKINQAHFNTTNNPVKKSVEEFLSDPELAEDKIALQDFLISRGYSAQAAFEKTEMFYRALKDKETYKN